MKEPLPLATIQEAVLEFLRNRSDAVLFDAQAINAYVDEPRMTQDVDVLSTRAAMFADELRAMLAERFKIAVRIREVAGGKGFRIFQLRQPKNRHLADVRQIDHLPPTQRIADIQIPILEELIAQKILSLASRSGQPKADTDRRDLKVLLLAYPQLKTSAGAVIDRLSSHNADERALAVWREFVVTDIQDASTDEDDWQA